MPTFFVMLDSYLSIAKQDVVDASDVNGCHFSVAVHVAGGEKSCYYFNVIKLACGDEANKSLLPKVVVVD